MKFDNDNFCGNCGKPVKNENFCMKCGYSLYSDDSETDSQEIQVRSSKSNPRVVYQKENGIGLVKKLLIGFGVLAILIIIVALIISFSFFSFVSDVTDGTIEKSRDFQVLEINETQTLGNMNVVIDEIEFYDEYAKIFLSVENLGIEESYIYQHNSYVKQGSTDFQRIAQPFGASGNQLDGHKIPSGVIREGIIYFEPWNLNEEFVITLDGLYVPPNQAFDYKLPESVTFVFNITPSKCGAGTVYDDATNSCIVK